MLFFVSVTFEDNGGVKGDPHRDATWGVERRHRCLEFCVLIVTKPSARAIRLPRASFPRTTIVGTSAFIVATLTDDALAFMPITRHPPLLLLPRGSWHVVRTVNIFHGFHRPCTCFADCIRKRAEFFALTRTPSTPRKAAVRRAPNCDP